MGGLGFEEHPADLAVVAGVGLAAGQGLFDEDVDGDAVLGVHHDQPAVGGAALHGAQDLPVVAVEDARVGHEQLEGRDALPHQEVHLLEGALVDVREDHVEGVVDGALAVGLVVPGVEALAQGVAHALDGEVDDRCGAAPGGGPGSGLERVRGRGAAERELHVGVRVDAARDDVLPARVDRAAGRPGLGCRGAVRGQGRHAAVLDQDVRVEFVGGGDHQAAADQGADAHGSPPTGCCGAPVRGSRHPLPPRRR